MTSTPKPPNYKKLIGSTEADPTLFYFHDPKERLTRGEFFVELLDGWRTSLRFAEERLRVPGMAQAASMLRAAIMTLMNSYEYAELLNEKFYKEEVESAHTRADDAGAGQPVRRTRRGQSASD